MAELKQEIAQQRPFSSLEEEALLNLMRSADCVQRAMQHTTRRWGITSTQYNVLRILRGAQPDGLTCSAIGDRMITAEPDITRLLARLKALKLIRQKRDQRDRRVLWTQICPTGLQLLAEMDPVVQSFPKQMFAELEQQELRQFIALLEKARKHCATETGCTDGDAKQTACELPLTCDGGPSPQQP